MAVGKLSREIFHACFYAPLVPDVHSGRHYETVALGYAEAVEKIRGKYAPSIFRVAKKIEAASDPKWVNDPIILNLWHNVAERCVKPLSEHSTKKVGALILSSDGELLAFGTNQVPNGIAKLGAHYVTKERKKYIVCAERIALGWLLDVNAPNRPEEEQSLGQTEFDVIQFGDDIVSAGLKSGKLKDCFLLTTASPCEICAEIIAPLKPLGVFVGNGGVGFSRPEGAAILGQAGIKCRSLPAIKCV